MKHTGKLQPIKHPQLDLFIADILEAVPKDDMASMEHPMFALKGKDMIAREYEHRGNLVKLTPSSEGLATIHDKDILIYLSSQIIEAMNRGREVSRTVRMTAYDFLVSTNRSVAGVGYQRLKVSLHRLRNTSIETNIRTGDLTIEEGFGWIDDWKIVRYTKTGKMVSVEVTLCQWLWNAIKNLEVLTISRDYFRLKKPLERRIYELCRKHCGSQKLWTISLTNLLIKSGSTSSKKEFRRIIKAIAESDHIPDYRLRYSETRDIISAYARSEKGSAAQVIDTIKDTGFGSGLQDSFVNRKKGQRGTSATIPNRNSPEASEVAEWESVDDDSTLIDHVKQELPHNKAVPQGETLEGEVEPAPLASPTPPAAPRPVIKHPTASASASAEGTDETTDSDRQRAFDAMWAALGRAHPRSRD